MGIRRLDEPLPTIKKRFVQDNRVSVCTDCRWGIFTHSEYVWTRRGYVHITCEKKRILDEAEHST